MRRKPTIILLFLFCLTINRLAAQLVTFHDIQTKKIDYEIIEPSNPIFSSDGLSLYFDFLESDSRKVGCIQIADPSSEIQRIDFPEEVIMAAPSPNKRTIFAVAPNRNNRISANHTNSRLGHIFQRKVEFKHPSFNHYGNLLGFAGKTENDQHYQLMTFDFKYDNLNQLTQAGSDIQYPRWSPDGAYISYHQKNEYSGRDEISVVHWDGLPAYHVAIDTLNIFDASWGKSNTRFICVGKNENGFWLLMYLMHEEELRTLAYSPTALSTTSWSINGKEVAFILQTDDNKKELILLTID